ncbi:RHS repeat domain-containing protein [Citrobacter enshiensis]|uniref:RHS repeat domain-containing protein n=1 Tax=Citrobacter enshiensis TaxID=2971264 RepID=UPI0023E7A703|nr:RHS repeat-associated core domain-containing protein [Citrobacter enshiensis]WET42272.1 RHS repeat-associated core domain-containing protein [Citrobacter enshiensis]
MVNEHNITWKYDANGRLVEKLVDKGGYRPLLWRYRWDARSQLTGLETPEGERWEYKYDPFGRRISKRCTNHDKPGMDFHWNGDQLTAEIPVGADGKQEDENTIRWIYEPGSFTPIARYEKGQLHYTVTDTVGRIQELLTEESTIAWRGKQQLWGREECVNDAKLTCRLRFPGQYEDEESGLYYNRFRYYDCETGQYLCADPLGVKGGINLYGYVKNPQNIVDPLGLSWLGKLRSAGKSDPCGLTNPHGHHIVFKGDFTGDPRGPFVNHSKNILAKYGIDPVNDIANLMWASNIEGVHTTDNARSVALKLTQADLDISDRLDKGLICKIRAAKEMREALQNIGLDVFGGY